MLACCSLVCNLTNMLNFFFVGRLFTVSIALPGSILENAQSPELRTYLAGQVKEKKLLKAGLPVFMAQNFIMIIDHDYLCHLGVVESNFY